MRKHVINSGENHLFSLKRAVLLFICILFVSTAAFSQNEHFTFKAEKIQLRQLLDKIQTQSSYKFLYRSDLVNSTYVKINVSNVSLQEALKAALDKTSLSYQILDDKLIVISTKESIVPTQQKITGIVTDTNTGEGLIGVSVIVKGTTAGTITDVNGKFKLEVSDGSTITISYIGYTKQEVKYTGQTPITIKLVQDSKSLDEVVVTALGIKREKKALGYALQEVKGEQILSARETNVTNALSGQVAGLQIVRSSNGPAGSSKINLRGNNSLTGDNQPLIVVDGIPMSNTAGAANNDMWNPSPDMGNGLSDLNPDDIESMSVLKGASAAALYGSRAGNGVILITTKAGKKQHGLGVTVSGTVGIESLFMRPEYQNSFGQGKDATYDPRSSTSWGPQITGQSVKNWDGSTVNMAAYDNVSNYFKNSGVNLTENITFQQAYDKTTVFSSLTRLNDKSLIPGAKLSRTNMMLRSATKFGTDDRWLFDAKVQYISTTATNRPLNGNNPSNSFLTMYLLPRSMDIRGFSSEKNAAGTMLWYPGAGSQMNPYWMADNSLAVDSRDRFLMNGSLKYKFAEWLNAEVKAGRDMYTTTTDSKLYSLSPLSATGQYSYGKTSFYENNFSALISAKKDNLIDRLGGAAQLGGNLMSTRTDGISGSAGNLLAPNLFSINNALNGIPTISEAYSTKKINSVYATAQLNWDGWAFLDGTFRNDWSSALSKDHRSFFYPSINGSVVVTEMLKKFNVDLPSWVTFAKIRASHAEVGNDMNPYQLSNVYKLSTDPTGAPVASTNKTLYNPDVRNELIKSSEIGTELRFFENRLSLDVAWYKSNSTNQLLNLPVDPLSGYTDRKINAGNVQNQGMEFMFNARILDNPKSFSWSLAANTSFNRNKIISLAPDLGVTEYDLGAFDNLKIVAKQGALYGDIYGTTFLRVKDGPNAGKLLLTAAGLPQMDQTQSYLGNQQASALLGITNSFSFKGFNLSFLVDARFGGKIFSGTNQAMQVAGTAAVTVVNGKRDNIVVPGVISDGNGGYTANTIGITPQQYWGATAGNGNLGIGEANVYDASNIRIRNIQFGYTIDRKLLTRTPFQSVRLGVTCNNVWMISSHLDGVDPESVYATGTNAVGYEYSSSPTTRSYLFNVSLGF